MQRGMAGLKSRHAVAELLQQLQGCWHQALDLQEQEVLEEGQCCLQHTLYVRITASSEVPQNWSTANNRCCTAQPLFCEEGAVVNLL